MNDAGMERTWSLWNHQATIVWPSKSYKEKQLTVWFGAWKYSEDDRSRKCIEDVEESQTERDIVRISEKNEQIGDDSDETINIVAANVETLDEEKQLIISQLNKILTGRRNTDGISFKKVDMITLNWTTAKVNWVIELTETKNITQTNNLIKAAGAWVADQLGLKKYEGGE